MRTWVVIVSMVLASVEPAAADVVIDLKAPDPVAKLPIVSADGMNFQRAFRRLRPKCKKFDVFVEDGGIDSTVDEPQYSSSQLLGGCGEARDAFAGNLTGINAAMKGTTPSQPAKRGTLVKSLPAMFEADGMRVDITGSMASALITVNRLDRGTTGAWIGTRRMAMDMRPVGVRAWYVVDQKAKRQLAVLIAGRQPDGTLVEKWMEVWVGKAPAKLAPIDVARRWLLAVAARDANSLAALTAVPFERVGFDALGPKQAACAKLTKATKADQLAPVLDCVIASAPSRYMPIYDEKEISKLPARPPAELARHGKTIGSLGGQPFLFSTDEPKGQVHVVIAVKGDKVAGVVEVAPPLAILPPPRK